MRRLSGLPIVFLGLLALTGCGVKSEPLPPVIRVADPTRDTWRAGPGCVYRAGTRPMYSGMSTSSGTACHTWLAVESV